MRINAKTTLCIFDKTRTENKLTKRKLPSLEDVARKAGVSTATVSRCLNQPDKVTETTREKVMAVVKELHYAPNFGARAIAANRTGTIGVVIPTMENAIFARGVEAFQEVLEENRMTMLVATSSYLQEREAEQIRTLIARGADGLLLIGTDRDPEIYEFLQQRQIPVVLAWAKSEDDRQSYVGFDNFEAARQLAELAIEKGHRNVGFIVAHTAMNDRARNRLAGAMTAIKQSGLDAETMPVIETNYSIGSGQKAFNDLMERSVRPSLVICGNDVLATGALQAALDRGMKIPGDVAITGFDDIELARIVRPTLTTVHVPHRDMGKRSAEALIDLLAGKPAPIRIDLATQIVERQSL